MNDFDSESLIVVVIKCFERIASMLNEKENFIDVKFLRSQNLKEATHKFKVCQAITSYLKVTSFNDHDCIRLSGISIT